MDVGQDEEARDAFVLQEVAAEAERQGAKASGDVSDLPGDFKGEAEPVVEPSATRRTLVTVVETSEFEPEERP
ncbi:hypothetical protein D8674_017205 [Pyrus ussuriensis x Pyrus communis]|uniref:Uncharacterized protein n=1 Tax=Pyrus ussuriensis x Pyrus communis TaxID=2448454 RepID=A0A5N5HCE7_9ROSA|nr:hypothetical protein D8674_017205 [Pyrus ussuriensis x Pyrus communis]